MRIAKLFKQQPPFTDARRKLRTAIEAGKIAEDADAAAALQLIFDSLDKVELVMDLEELGSDTYIPSVTVRDLLWRLDRLDREYVSDHEK